VADPRDAMLRAQHVVRYMSTVSVINWWPMTVTSLPHWSST